MAGLAGLLLAWSLPKWHLSVLAWLAPGILLATGMGQPRSVAFRCGYVGGLVFHLVTLYWLLLIPVSIAPIFGWLALAAFLALYPAVWVWLCLLLYDRLFAPDPYSGTFWERFLGNRWPRQLLWYLTCAAIWVAIEMVQGRFLTGFPWNYLGVSQYRMVPLIQIASFTGVHGLSFLMAWFSVALVSAAAMVVLRPSRSRDWMIEIMPPLFALALVTAYGMRQVFYAPDQRAGVNATLIQPSIPQTVIWDAAQGDQRFQDLIELTRDAAADRPSDIIIWPEAALPGLFRFETNINVVVTNLVRQLDAYLVLGGDDVRWDEPRPGEEPSYRFYNASFLLNPEGRLINAYYKRRLVMFGEYVPLASQLPFLRDFTSVQGDFSPGAKPARFQFPDLDMEATVLICFEDTFAPLTRRSVTKDVDFIINITNDGWFGQSAAQWQHAATAIFRAIENRLPLVRCTNNGLTCLVDEWGRLHQVYFPDSKDIYGRGYKHVRIPFRLNPGTTTFYHRYGDWFGWACVGWTVLLLVWTGLRPPHRRY